MSKIAAVRLYSPYDRYQFTSRESLVDGTANASDYLFNLKIFGEVAFIVGEPEPPISPISEESFKIKTPEIEINTPEAAIDPSDLMNNLSSLLQPLNPLDIETKLFIVYVNCPYTTDHTCFLVNDKFTENSEFYNWAKTASAYGKLPRTPEEVESDRIREEEDEKRRLTEVRPEQQGSIALVQIMDSIQFQVQIITLDLANTRVRDVQRYLAKIHKLTWYDGGLFSTNELSIDRVKKYFQDSRSNIKNYMVFRLEAINMFMSVVDNQKNGSKKNVGVDSNNREHITSSQRLSDIKGNVIVYYHSGLSRESTISQFGEKFLDAVIDILIG